MTITHRPTRALLAVPPTLMTTAVVVTGNHFIIDAIAGIALSLLGLVGAHRRKQPAGVAPSQQRRLLSPALPPDHLEGSGETTAAR